LIKSRTDSLGNQSWYPARSGPLRKIRDLLNLSDDAVTRDGQPLLPDIHPEKYLSTQYDRSDLTRLENFGLGYMPIDNLIARARADLASETRG